MVTLFDVSYTTFKQAAELYTIYYAPTPVGDGYILGTGNAEVVYTVTIRDSSDIINFVNTLLSISELSEKEGDVLARPTLTSTGNLQKRFDLIDPGFIYIGSARPGVLDSAVGWTIKRFTLDVDGNVVDKKVTVADSAIWDDRAIEIYG